MNHYSGMTTEQVRELEERRVAAGLTAEVAEDRDRAARRRMARSFVIAPDGSVTTNATEDWSGYHDKA